MSATVVDVFFATDFNESMQNLPDNLRRHLAAVHARMNAACERAGRSPNSVRLVAVTKYAQLDWIRALVEIGHYDLAENKPQQLLERAEQISGPIVWHQIGTLQRNKIRKVLPVATWIHSIDSLKLLADVDRIAGEIGVRPQLLLQVNISGEEAKHGFEPGELLSQWHEIEALPHVDIQGLMTMAPYVADPETVRPVFRDLRRLRDQLIAQADGRLQLPELSMGMSGDYEVAIEEGATMVRIGSALFEGLDGPDER